MKLSKEQIQAELIELGGTPIFGGADVFLLFGEPISTNKIENIKQLIQHVFAAGQGSKIRELKQVLNITDPRT